MSERLSTLALLLAFVVALCGLPNASAQEIAELPGPLLLIGGRHQDLPKSPSLCDAFFDLAGGKKAKIVVIPTAVGKGEVETPDIFLRPWQERGPLWVRILHTRDPKMANDTAFVKPLTEATAVFFANGHGHRIFDAYRGTLVEKELKKLHARGGAMGGTGTGASVLCELMSNRGKKDRPAVPGFGFLPGFLIDDGGDDFAIATAANPAYVGLTVEPGAAVEIRGKTLRVIGKQTVTIHLAKGAAQEAKTDTLRTGARLDLIELRRAAASRGAKTTSSEKEPGEPSDRWTALLGAWAADDQHLAMGSLYQPHHGTRVRHATVQFANEGGKLTGHAVMPEHDGITGQRDWKDGRTDFRTVTFADGKLTFEFDIQDVKHGSRRRVKDKATIRVEAVLRGDRLSGKWGLFLQDGSEPFRGAWEAIRAAAKKPPKGGERPTEPLQSGYRVGERVLPLLPEYRINGHTAGRTGSLTCMYMYQPVVVIYTREITPPLIRLAKKVDQITAKYTVRPLPPYKDRLASYMVLVCDSKDREKELKELVEKEKIEAMTIALVVVKEGLFLNKLGEAETTILLTGPRAVIKASHAFRKGELTDKDAERILAELSRIRPKEPPIPLNLLSL